MTDQSTDEQSASWVEHVFLSLREGDTVYINDRDRPLTLVNRWWDDRESGYWRLELEGYGTTYRTIISLDGGVSVLRTEGGKRVRVSTATRGEGEAIVSDTTAAEWLGEAGIDVR